MNLELTENASPFEEPTENSSDSRNLAPATKIRNNLEGQISRDAQFLSLMATEIAELPSDADIYTFIGEKIAEIVGNSAIVVIIENQADRASFSIRSLFAANDESEFIDNALGQDFLTVSGVMTSQHKVSLGIGKIVRLTGGFRKLFGQAISEDAASAIEKRLSLEGIHVAGFSWNKTIHGGVCFLKRKNTAELRTALIEAILNQASLALELRQSKKILTQTERRLWRSQRLESAGRVTAGMTHNFNNILGAIIALSELSSFDVDPKSQLYEQLGQIVKLAERGASLTRKLQDFSRPSVKKPEVFKVNDQLLEMRSILRQIAGENIETSLLLDQDLGLIEAEPDQIEQIIMNLVTNAKDAMPNGGKLTIETSNVQLDDEYSRFHLNVMPGPYVQISVSDTGCGMDENTKSRIFDPFFTTKEAGKGTGLGLFTVYGMVRQLSGSIWVHSEPERGTSFNVYLPPHGKAESTLLGRTSELPKGSETILVVDDDELLRVLFSMILKRAGYTVMVAGDGGEAIEIERKNQGHIDLMIADIAMPQMGGIQVFERFASTSPVIFTSSSPHEKIRCKGLEESPNNFISKPFTARELLSCVRNVLDDSKDSRRNRKV